MTRRDSAWIQFAWYLLVGGLSTGVDLGTFMAFTRFGGLPTLVASPVSFLLGTAFNYVASYTLAFRRGRYDRGEEIGRLLAVVAVGLALNTFFVWLFVTVGLTPPVAKVLAVPCVLAWNFLGRRFFVFHDELPETTWEMTNKVLGDD